MAITDACLKANHKKERSKTIVKTDRDGLGVANVHTSLIATAWRAGVNVYEYLVDIQ